VSAAGTLTVPATDTLTEGNRSSLDNSSLARRVRNLRAISEWKVDNATHSGTGVPFETHDDLEVRASFLDFLVLWQRAVHTQ
jgi:hypothetical protein